MDIIQVVFLAIIQGLTEFLPISSSAHLILPSQILGWQDQGLAFDVAVHVGTLFAVMIYFRQEVGRLLVGWGQSLGGKQSDDGRLAWLVIVATIPAGLTGLLLGDLIESHLRTTMVIAVTTIVFGILLYFADQRASHSRVLGDIRLIDALIIGGAQCLALIPGTSRSGITMTAALFLGLDREASAKYSFLLSIPLILAAGGLKALELLEQDLHADWSMIGLGSLLSFLSAYACIHLFMKFLEKVGFTPFVIYRLLLGGVLFLFFI